MQICKTQLLPGWSCFPVSRYFLLSVCFLLIPQLIIFLFSRRRHPPTPPRPPIPQIPARPPIPPSQDLRFPCFRSFFWLQIGVVYLVAAVASCFELLPRFEVLLALCFFCFESAANRFLLRQRRYRRHTTPPPPGNRRGSCGREGPPPPRCWTARAGRRRQRCWAARAGRRRQPRQRRKRRWRREVHRLPLHDGDQDAARVSAGAPAGNAGGGGGRGVRLVPSRLVSRSVL